MQRLVSGLVILVALLGVGTAVAAQIQLSSPAAVTTVDDAGE